MVTPTTSPRARWPSSKYPAPGNSQPATATSGGAAVERGSVVVRGMRPDTVAASKRGARGGGMTNDQAPNPNE